MYDIIPKQCVYNYVQFLLNIFYIKSVVGSLSESFLYHLDAVRIRRVLDVVHKILHILGVG